MAINSKFKIPDTHELLRSLKNARSEWKLKTPMQKWCYFYGIGRAVYRLVRISLMQVDISRTQWFGYILLVYATVVPLLSLYTVCYYAFHGDLLTGLPSTCAAFILIGHFPIVLMCLFGQRFKLQSLIDFGGHYIYHDSHENIEYNRICSNHMDKTMKVFLIKIGIMVFSFAISAYEPMKAFLVNGILITAVSAKIPFTEPNSNAEFIVNFFIQTVLAVHGVLVYTGLECFLSTLENAVTIAPRLIKSDLEHTIQLYEKKKITELQLQLKIGNIVKQSNDADNYVDRLSKQFYWRNLFTPTCFTYMIGMGIFCKYAIHFPSGYGMACLSWVQLFYVCEFGENIQDNGFDDMLYQSKWEVLPLNIQKAIMLLIHRKQNEKGLRMGPFGMGINRESFKLSANKIYTFVMFLKNFFG